MKIHCPECETACHELEPFCTRCGHRLVAHSSPPGQSMEPKQAIECRCPKCQAPCEKDARMCYACGHRFPAGKPSPQSTEHVSALADLAKGGASMQDQTNETPTPPLLRAHRLICTVCAGPVSDLAASCPRCGHPTPCDFVDGMGALLQGLAAIGAFFAGAAAIFMLLPGAGTPLAGIHAGVVAILLVTLARRR